MFCKIKITRANTIKLIVALGISQLAGFIGSVFTIPAITTWYAALNKPALNPPAWVFGPVWTTLYILMGMAAFLIWADELAQKSEKRQALAVFGLQLTLNALWSIIFFGLHNPALALVNIILLWLAIAFTIIVFYKLSKSAAYLLIPYLAWVSFAGYLNYAIWILN